MPAEARASAGCVFWGEISVIGYQISGGERGATSDPRSATGRQEKDTVEGAEERGVKRKERRRGTVTQRSQRTQSSQKRERKGQERKRKPETQVKTGTWGTRLVVFLGKKERERKKKYKSERV